jgi:hypothetical protein
MTDRMAVLEGPEYGETRKRLMADPVVVAMAEELRRAGPRARDAMVHEDGSPNWNFMMRANDEYAKRTGHGAEAHIGGVAEAILLLLG